MHFYLPEKVLKKFAKFNIFTLLIHCNKLLSDYLSRNWKRAEVFPIKNRFINGGNENKSLSKVYSQILEKIHEKYWGIKHHITKAVNQQDTTFIQKY